MRLIELWSRAQTVVPFDPLDVRVVSWWLTCHPPHAAHAVHDASYRYRATSFSRYCNDVARTGTRTGFLRGKAPWSAWTLFVDTQRHIHAKSAAGSGSQQGATGTYRDPQ